MSRWKMLETWDRDIPGLTDQQLAERRQLASDYERSSDARRPGRNPKARRDWRQRREAIEEEITRRQADAGEVGRRTE